MGNCTIFLKEPIFMCGLGSVVGIATAYGLDGPGIESRWGWDFLYPSRLALRPTQPPVQLGTGSFPGVRCGRGVTLTPHPPSSAEVKNRVELYLYSPWGPSWPMKGWNLPTYIHSHHHLDWKQNVWVLVCCILQNLLCPKIRWVQLFLLHWEHTILQP